MGKEKERYPRKVYEEELLLLQKELVKLQAWIKEKGLQVVVIFEGRDAAGKGGVIGCITEHLSNRVCRVVALPTPSERERSQWYFQRYVAQLPARGELVLFDRSWYNRGGVEPVMGFCTPEQHRQFLEQCPAFENLLMDSGILLFKYWFSVSMEEQDRRFAARNADPVKRWKLSPIDLAARSRWEDYSRAKDTLFARTDTERSPWYVVPSDCKRKARVNMISHLLSRFAYEDLTPGPVKLESRPPRKDDYERPPYEGQRFVPDVAGGLLADAGAPVKKKKSKKKKRSSPPESDGA